MLFRRIVELGVGVGQLHARHKQFKPRGVCGIVLFASGQRAQRRRIIDHKCRSDEIVLDRGFKHLIHDHGIVHICFVQIELPGFGPDGVDIVYIAAAVFLQQIGVSGPPPGPGKIQLEFAER